MPACLTVDPARGYAAGLHGKLMMSQQLIPRPISPVQIRLGNIPKDLKKLDRWILWKYTRLATGKWTKTPHSAVNGFKIDATNFDNGVSFMAAAKAMRDQREQFDGLGFLLGNGIAGIDVDDCIDNDGNLDDRGQRMSSAYASTYAEISPSGQGFKIIVNIGDDPKLASIGKNSGGMEIYGGRRYFTVTGALLHGHPSTVASMSEAFARTAEEMGINKHKPPTPAGPVDVEHAKNKLGIDLTVGREMLDHLPFVWCDVYGEWLRAGMALHHEFDGSEQALALWDEWSQRNPVRYQDGACEAKWRTFGRPGKDYVTMRTLVRDAQAGGWRAPKTIERAIQDFTVLDETDAVQDWWAKFSIGPMLSTDPEPFKWVWEGILQEAKVMVLAGSGGSSKSYLMLAAATQYALGNSWGPFVMSPATTGKVLVLYGEEDFSDVHHRAHSLRHAFMLTDEQVARVAAHMAVLPLRGQNVSLAEYGRDDREVIITQATKKLEARIKQYDVKLLVLDPMALLHGLDENDNRAISHFIQELDALCIRTGCAVVLVHHFSKSVGRAREVNESNVRGASSLVNHVRTVAVMHRLRRDESAEWGVPEEDHARWTMFNVVKTNYGPTGVVTWFNVSQTNGVITPSEVQLTFMNSRDIRMAALAAIQETQVEQDQELSAAAERRARQQAERQIRLLRHMEIILRTAIDHNADAIPSHRECRELILSTDSEATGVSGRTAVERILELEYAGLEGRRTMISQKGRDWLEAREILS